MKNLVNYVDDYLDEDMLYESVKQNFKAKQAKRNNKEFKENYKNQKNSKKY